MAIPFGRLICGLASILLMPGLEAAAHARTFPSSPVSLVVSFPAGGSSDTFARVLANKLGKLLGEPVVILNRGGAAGVVGTQSVISAPANGYTLLLTSVGAASIVPAISNHPPYDVVKQLKPVSIVAQVPEGIFASKALGVKTLAEAIKAAKAKPGELNFGSTGYGSLPHLVGEELNRSAAINLVQVPYQGAAPAMSDFLAGRLNLMISDITPFLPFVKTGDAIPLAVTGKARSPLMPDVPTTAELGYGGVFGENWFGVFAPIGVPDAVVNKLSLAINEALADPKLKSVFETQGGAAQGDTPEQFRRLIEDETDTWKKVGERAHIQLN